MPSSWCLNQRTPKSIYTAPAFASGAGQVQRLVPAGAGGRGLRPRHLTRPGRHPPGSQRLRNPREGGCDAGRDLLRLGPREQIPCARHSRSGGSRSVAGGVSQMVMAMLDPTAAEGGLDSAVRQSILDQVIDAVNREFPGSLLRSPDEIGTPAGDKPHRRRWWRLPSASANLPPSTHRTGAHHRGYRPARDGAGLPRPAPAAGPHRPLGDHHLFQRPDPGHEEGQRALGRLRPGGGSGGSLAGAEPGSRSAVALGQRSHAFGERQAARHAPQPGRGTGQGAASGDRTRKRLPVREHPPVRAETGPPGVAARTPADVQRDDGLPGGSHAVR